MSTISIRMHRRVVFRAGDRCEYCGLAQEGQEATFHIDHIIPVSAGGPTVLDNLALACVSCSLRKAARRSGRDPESGRTIPLFHPRRQRWSDHFRWQDVRAVGLTPTGRATIATLQLNRPSILVIRAEETAHGRHPPLPRVPRGRLSIGPRAGARDTRPTSISIERDRRLTPPPAARLRRRSGRGARRPCPSSTGTAGTSGDWACPSSPAPGPS
jgi:hypothetical protein